MNIVNEGMLQIIREVQLKAEQEKPRLQKGSQKKEISFISG